MARTHIEWRIKGFEEIRRSPGVKADLARRADAIREAAGDGYDTSNTEGRTRSRATVITAEPEAMRDNAQHNTLLRALDAGR